MAVLIKVLVLIGWEVGNAAHPRSAEEDDFLAFLTELMLAIAAISFFGIVQFAFVTLPNLRWGWKRSA